jgi:hypothetical protein
MDFPGRVAALPLLLALLATRGRARSLRLRGLGRVELRGAAPNCAATVAQHAAQNCAVTAPQHE